MSFEVCRICGSNTELKSILDKGPEMIKKLLNYASVQVFHEDSLPNFICQQCDQHLDLSVNLRKPSDETARRLRKELKTKNQPAVVEEPATSSISCKKDINLNLQYTSVTSSTQMAIESSIESSSFNACKKENKPIHVQIKIESSDIDEEEFQMIDNSNLVLENESNDNFEVYGSLEARPTSITEAQNDIKIEEVKLIPPDQISMDGNDAVESQNYSQMQQNDTNDMFIESEIKAYPISNPDINAQKSPSESTSFVGNGSMDISPLSDFATGDSEDLNLNIRSKSLCETGHSSLLTCPTCAKELYSEKDYVKHLKEHEKTQTKGTHDNLIEIAHPISNKTKKCTCNVCKEKFTHLDDLKRHMELHSDKYSYTCTTCFNSYKKRAYLKRHVKRHHPESNMHKKYSTTQPSTHGVNTPHKCDFCFKSFQYQSQLTRHKVVHSDLPPEYSCSLCLAKFRRKDSLGTHIRKHSKKETFMRNKKLFKCKICKHKFYTRNSLTQHESLKHSANDRPHKCDICLKSFKQFKCLKLHKLVHLPPQLSCLICLAKFRLKGSLAVHMRIHTNERRFECEVCFKKFRHSDSLKRHIKLLHRYTNTPSLDKDVPKLLNEVDRLEDSPTSSNMPILNKDVVKLAKDNQESEVLKLTKHDPTENNHQWIPGVNILKKNQCDYCGKQLKTRLSHHKHIQNVHPNVKPTQTCKTCSKTFYTLKSLTQHERFKHSGINGPHKCDICLKSFKQLSSLTLHKLVHLPPQHSCTICPTKFRHKSNLYVHMRIHSKGKPYKCGICSEKFLYSYLLKRHKKNHSGTTASSENINPLEKNEPKLLHKDDRLEDSAASSNWQISNKDTVKLDEDDCIDFSEESQQHLPSTSKTQIGNTECPKIAQNIIHENCKTISFSLPSNSSTSTTESNFIELIKVEEYQTIEQNVDELKTYEAKISSIYNIEDFI